MKDTNPILEKLNEISRQNDVFGEWIVIGVWSTTIGFVLTWIFILMRS